MSLILKKVSNNGTLSAVDHDQNMTAIEDAVNGMPSGSVITTHISNIENPHAVTKEQVGLGSVDNTADVDKPVSTAMQVALNGKADASAMQVALDSKADASAMQVALDSKADISEVYTKAESETLLQQKSDADKIVVAAYQSSTQSMNASVVTKLLFQTELIDSHNLFDASRFTPDVAGWYRINVRAAVTGTNTLTRCFLQLIKNGTIIYNDEDNQFSASIRYMQTSRLVYFNGTSDYLEAYIYVEGNSATTRITNQAVIFEAEFVRSPI